VPPRGFVQEACTRKAAMACGEAIVWPALRVQASSFYKLVRAVVS